MRAVGGTGSAALDAREYRQFGVREEGGKPILIDDPSRQKRWRWRVERSVEGKEARVVVNAEQVFRAREKERKKQVPSKEERRRKTKRSQ